MQGKAQIPFNNVALFTGFSLLVFTSLALAAWLNEPTIAALPVGLLIAYLAITDFRKIFYLLLFMLPLSTEFDISPGLATDLPTEPLMVGLMLVMIIFMVSNPSKLDIRFFKHPIIVFVILHALWVLVAAFYSEVYLVSFKFLAAKLWYIFVFVFMAAMIIRDEKIFRKAFWVIFIPLFFTIIQTIIRHSITGFAFSEINPVVVPFYRNHVNYAAMITLFFPFILLARTWYRPGTFTRRFLNFSVLVMLLAIYFAYTRACWLGLSVGLACFVLIRKRLFSAVAISGLATAILIFVYLAGSNKYLEFAPEFKKTIYHENISDHIEATVQLQDVSSMERFYRWIAAVYMIKEDPVTGFGPGNFYPFYKSYTVNSFETYVSENEERSTVHNYFLLILVEQGIPGILIFIILSLLIFIYGQRIYYQTQQKDRRNLVLAIMVSMVVIYVNLLLSDLIEVDKTGTLFFMNIAILVNIDLLNRKHRELPSSSVIKTGSSE